MAVLSSNSGLILEVKERHLLVVDDDRLVRDSIVEYLDDSGFKVTSMETAQQALSYLSESSVDLVVCDLKMPEMDGLSLLKKIRGLWPSLPVVVVSGAGGMSDVVSALRLGASDYLVKPIINLEVLVHSIERSLEQADLVSQNELYRSQLEQTNIQLKRSLKMLEEDQIAARTVQMNMLPSAKMHIAGLECEHILVPSLVLSGDFLDYQAVDQYKTLFYMADVSGHGASSALVTVLLKSSLQRYFEQLKIDASLQVSPLAWLKRVHFDLRRANLGKYLTCFAGLYDRQKKVLSYCVAGHYPRPILTYKKQVQFMECGGMPVGLMQELICEQREMLMEGPFRIDCCSDGILEIMQANNLAEKEFKLLIKAQTGRLCVDAIKHDIEVYEQENQVLPDDIALLSVSSDAFIRY